MEPAPFKNNRYLSPLAPQGGAHPDGPAPTSFADEERKVVPCGQILKLFEHVLFDGDPVAFGVAEALATPLARKPDGLDSGANPAGAHACDEALHFFVIVIRAGKGLVIDDDQIEVLLCPRCKDTRSGGGRGEG